MASEREWERRIAKAVVSYRDYYSLDKSSMLSFRNTLR